MIETGQSFSLWMIRLAVIAWFAFAWQSLSLRNGYRNWRSRRMLWTTATILYLLHVLSAFAWFHQWNHNAAEDHTAEVTLRVTGIAWGGGIWFNHLFTVVCVLETIAWWVHPRSILQRSRLAGGLVYGFCLFIGFNATVVFAHGPVRWISLSLLFLLAIRWLVAFRTHE